MTPKSAVEFSRVVPLLRLGPEPFRQHISASDAECAELARRFELVAVEHLSADVELVRQGGDRILLRAAYEAAFVQSCVVTLDPVPGTVSERFALVYGPPQLEADGVGGVEDDAAFEPLTGEAIDIGEAVAQEFALALPPFPRRADAEVADAAEETAAPGPFAALGRLVGRSGGG